MFICSVIRPLIRRLSSVNLVFYCVLTRLDKRIWSRACCHTLVLRRIPTLVAAKLALRLAKYSSFCRRYVVTFSLLNWAWISNKQHLLGLSIVTILWRGNLHFLWIIIFCCWNQRVHVTISLRLRFKNWWAKYWCCLSSILLSLFQSLNIIRVSHVLEVELRVSC